MSRDRASAAVLAPLLALLACGPHRAFDQLGDDALAAVFRDLHRPVYDVYELGPDADAVHRLLARSFVGEALTRQYVEHYTTLVRMDREQTSIRVVRVDYEAVQVLARGPRVVSLDADWSVGGIVSHQRHKHLRTNRYRAVYDLAPADDGWRIVDTRLKDLQRVDTGLGLATDLPATAGGLMSPLELLRAGVGEELEDRPDAAAEEQAGEDLGGEDLGGEDRGGEDRGGKEPASESPGVGPAS